MKILKHGKQKKGSQYKGICGHCACEFIADDPEINWTEDRGMDHPTIDCPVCHQKVWLNEVEK